MLLTWWYICYWWSRIRLWQNGYGYKSTSDEEDEESAENDTENESYDDDALL